MRESLGKPNCPKCRGYGYVNVAPEVRESEGKRIEYPRVVPCECRLAKAERPGPAVSDRMKLDAQSRAAGESE